MNRRFGNKLLWVLLAGMLAADDVTAATSWLRVQSQHFTVTGNTNEAQLTRIAIGLEDFLPVLMERFPAARVLATKGMPVTVFKDAASYDPFKPDRQGSPTNAAGYFLPGEPVDRIVAVVGAETERVIYHELFHAVSRHDSNGPLPTWANEGLAEFYSTFDTHIGDILPYHVRTLRTRTWIPLVGLLAASKESSLYNESDRQSVFYAESWALIHYLLTANGERREQLSAYVALRSSGKPIQSSVSEAFHEDLTELETHLREYVAAFPFRYRMAAPRPRIDGAALEVSPMTDAESMTRLGELSLHLNRLDEADELLQAALGEQPAFPGTFAAMGALRMQQSRNPEALDFFQRAVDADAHDYLAHFRYGMVLQSASVTVRVEERKGQLELSRRHLLEAIRLAPWFVEAYPWLGYVAIALEDGYDATEKALKNAIAIQPDRMELQAALADVRTAEAMHFERERTRRERESRKHLADALQLLRVPSPPIVVTYELWKMPAAPEPKRRTSYPTLDGFLIAIECRDGITLVIRSNDGVVRFHTKTPRRLEFTSKVSNAANEAACGMVHPEHAVTVTYKREPSEPWSKGEPIKIEYK